MDKSLWLTVAVGAALVGAGVYLVVKYRQLKAKKAAAGAAKVETKAAPIAEPIPAPAPAAA